MITYALMSLIVIFLAFTLLFKAKLNTDASPDQFFDKTNSNAMRGFWCLIVILVHVPATYQNAIQDMLGSFAYIGVTFFFMTSAFGLKLGVSKDPDNIKKFWRKRLPKLLVPCLLVNIVGIVSALIRTGLFKWMTIITIDTWVLWLLVCYVIFWCVYRFVPVRGGYKDALICILIIAFSCVMYVFNKFDTSSLGNWSSEVYGFIWGIVLSNLKDRLVGWVNKKWLTKVVVFCILAGVLGILYLKFKPVVFFGDYILKIVLGLAIIVFMLVANTRIEIGNRISLFLGSISYEIYLLHHTVFALVAFFAPEAISGVFVVASIIITVILAIIVHKIGEPITKKLVATLC